MSTRGSEYLCLSRAIIQHPELGIGCAIIWAVIRELPTDTDGWAAADSGGWDGPRLLTRRQSTRAVLRLRDAGLIDFRQADRGGRDVRCDTSVYAALCRAWEKGRGDGR